MKNRLDFPQHLIERGLTGEGVEVGVLFGEYSEAILASWPGVLHLVDPWENQPVKVYRDGCNAVDMEEALEDTRARVAQYGDRAKIHRTYSSCAVDEFADGQLDFVYIDANHRYEAVMADIRAWWPKVKAGGILGGHDYYDLSSKFLECGVRKAVREFARAEGLKVETTPDCTSWWITKVEARPMVAVLGLSHVDMPHAIEWLRWAAYLCSRPGGDLSRYTLVISCTQRITEEQKNQLRAELLPFPELFQIDFHTLPDLHERGYPGSASHLFVRSMEYASAAYPGAAILWLESDTVPLKPGWMRTIETEYLFCGMPFMGHLEFDCQPKHMAGVGVYPPNWRELSPLLATSNKAPDSRTFGPGRGQAFDTYAAPEVFPLAAEAETIHQIWKPTDTDTRLLAMISVDAVLFHQCKDARLIRLLAERRFPEYLQKAVA
ncbi:MAG TPA: class I SAM-dependent methyltransferase [Flavobacteriales bacterium]|nr:class I SAM-dependent methyltransferase [Flavobacteriales bacterium]